MAYANVNHLADDYNGLMEQVDFAGGVTGEIRKDIETVFSDTRILERIKTPVDVTRSLDENEVETGVQLYIWNNNTDYVRLIFEGGKRVRYRYALHTPEKPATGNGTLLLLPGHRMVIANLLSAMYTLKEN